MNFKQLTTPLKILVVILCLALVWIVYMAGFLSFPPGLSQQQMENVNATKTAIAERWYMLLRPGFTGTPTITRTPSITPTPTLTGTVTLTPSKTPTPTRTAYFFPTVVHSQPTTSQIDSSPTPIGPTAAAPSPTPGAPTIAPTQTSPPATNTSGPMPTLPLPTLPPPTLEPTQPSPTQPASTNALIEPTKEPKPTKTPKDLIGLLNGVLGIGNNVILYHLLSRVSNYFIQVY